MSGSGGSYLGPDTPSDTCASLRFDTQLASPKAQVIAGLQVGDGVLPRFHGRFEKG